CVLGAWRGEEAISAPDFAPEDLSTLAAVLLEADPGAELLLDVGCPACSTQWKELLDVAAFFWAELESRSRRVLSEVHLLARAYNWRESEILALSPRRRRHYLELLGA
ncbi:MAG TPA: phage baseplate protein, partial [Thermoanaerobaculia bacterium]|nr:phage baseplate protein [Thermoanaerobaculia bacterium]